MSDYLAHLREYKGHKEEFLKVLRLQHTWLRSEMDKHGDDFCIARSISKELSETENEMKETEACIKELEDKIREEEEMRQVVMKWLCSIGIVC